MLVVAGLEGNDLAGPTSAVAWVGQLTAGYPTNQAIRRLLDTSTLYLAPRLNPDAAEGFFQKPKMETPGSDSPVDDDHDGLSDEDGPEDLDGDGQITWMRVRDPEGDYILDPAEPRLLIRADKAKGQAGAWRLLAEGIDNDGDLAWNEDGPGGVNFNRNFPYDYRFFAPWTGRHQVSEIETRALADFVVDHPNIAIVFTFGAADNLLETPASSPAPEPGSEAGSPAPRSRRPATSIHRDDAPFYRELGKAWREALGLSKELKGHSEPGTFSDWMYFHRGRLSLAARPWSPAMQLELVKAKSKESGKEAASGKKSEIEDESKPEGEKAVGTEAAGQRKGAVAKKIPDEKLNEEDRAYLKWLQDNAPEAFVAWKPFAHPDFAGKKVEIGGFAPFAKSNPPARLLAEFADRQARFLTGLAAKLPRIGIRVTKVKSLGESVYDVTIRVENNGYLPTALAQGNLTREVHPTRLSLDVEEQELLSGAKLTMLGPIEGSGGRREVRYIIHAKGRKEIPIKAVSMLGGSVQTRIKLPEGE
jgi:hypothetical protein